MAGVSVDQLGRCANCGTPFVPGFGTCATCGRLVPVRPAASATAPAGAAPSGVMPSGVMPPPRPLPPPQAMPPAWSAPTRGAPSATTPTSTNLPAPSRLVSTPRNSPQENPAPGYVRTRPRGDTRPPVFTPYGQSSPRARGAGAGFLGTVGGLGFVIVLMGGVLAAMFAASGSSTPPSHGFRAAGSMSTARDFAAAAVLADGRVLVTGGDDRSEGSGTTALRSAELYDPATGTFAPTGSMAYAREYHTATLLKDGRVLITGGSGKRVRWADPMNTAELYDPATGKFTETGRMNVYRHYHTATLLPDGKVLVAGGAENGHDHMSAETYDPATGRFTRFDSMKFYRVGQMATALADGRVLLAGGYMLDNAEIYDPATGEFVQTAGSMNEMREQGTATLLKDGRVLIAGGLSEARGLADADVFDPATGVFGLTGGMDSPRSYFTATVLGDGRVLLAGGWTGSDWLASTQLFDPATGRYFSAPDMAYSRVGHWAALLNDGTVLIGGGTYSTEAEIYVP